MAAMLLDLVVCDWRTLAKRTSTKRTSSIWSKVIDVGGLSKAEMVRGSPLEFEWLVKQMA
jgi:hypothetical protein